MGGGWAGLIMQGVSSAVGGVMDHQTAQYNKRVAKANAVQAELDAAEEAERQRRVAGRIAGTRRAIAGANGVEGGSVIDSAEDQAAELELDALTTLYMGRREAGQYRQQAAAFKMQGRNALIGAALGMSRAGASGLDEYYRRREKTPQQKSGIGNPGYSDMWDGTSRA